MDEQHSAMVHFARSGGGIRYRHGSEIFVADTQEAAAKAEHYGAASELTRDEDVLDTWFSSALWPFHAGLAGRNAGA